jgi:hypothetical protein
VVTRTPHTHTASPHPPPPVTNLEPCFAWTLQVGSLAYQRTVATKLHSFGRAGVVARPVLMACMFGVAGMVLAPVAALAGDVRDLFQPLPPLVRTPRAVAGAPSAPLAAGSAPSKA